MTRRSKRKESEPGADGAAAADAAAPAPCAGYRAKYIERGITPQVLARVFRFYGVFLRSAAESTA